MKINLGHIRQLSALALMTICAGCHSTRIEAVSESMCLDEQSLGAKEQSAGKGDVDAMRLLWMHFDVCIGDRSLALKWLRAAAMAGDADSRSTLLAQLRRLRIPEEVAEAERLEDTWRREANR